MHHAHARLNRICTGSWIAGCNRFDACVLRCLTASRIENGFKLECNPSVQVKAEAKWMADQVERPSGFGFRRCASIQGHVDTSPLPCVWVLNEKPKRISVQRFVSGRFSKAYTDDVSSYVRWGAHGQRTGERRQKCAVGREMCSQAGHSCDRPCFFACQRFTISEA